MSDVESIRRSLRSRDFLFAVARRLAVPVPALEAFTQGASLAPDLLARLVRMLGGTLVMETTPKVSGVDILRQALASRNRKTNLAGAARDCGVSPADLDAFVANKLMLAPAALQALARRIFDAALDETGMLRSINRQPPIAMGSAPPDRFDPSTVPPLVRPVRGPIPVDGPVPQTSGRIPVRPGWSSD